MATVEEGPPGTMKVCSVAPPSIRLTPPTDFLDVLRGWGQTWKWDDLRVTGSTDWIAHAIADNSLVAVTDGSYIKEHWPELCSAAFVLECTKGQGQLTGAFAEASVAANPYRGELLGLMAIHLLLLVVKTVSPSLSGSAAIYSDCIGALGRVAKLPPYRIPSVPMPVFGHPKDHYGQFCQPFPSIGSTIMWRHTRTITLGGRICPEPPNSIRHVAPGQRQCYALRIQIFPRRRHFRLSLSAW